MIALEKVSVRLGSTKQSITALDDVSLEIRPGHCQVIMGPSGSGKTTLLATLGLLIRPSSGAVKLDGHRVDSLDDAARTSLRARYVGFVFQAFRLFRSLTALENVALAGRVAKEPAARAAALELLQRLNLGEKRDLKPDALSGGEKQRVAIARALVSNPPLILADEPTASLDGRSGEEIMGLLHSLARERGKAVVVVTHDHRLVRHADSLIELNDGRLVA